MAQLGNTIINGILRVNGAINTSGSITASSFVGDLTGNATSATKATQDSDGNAINTTYLKKSGGTMTGALNLANNVYNKIGDDVSIGDINVSGKLGIKGLNGATGIRFAPYSGSTNQDITIDGAGVMTITGTVASTFSGSLSGNATSATKATQDSDGNAINTTYLKKSGGTMTGAITLKGLVAQSLLYTKADFDTLADGIYHTATDESTSNNISHAPVARSQMFITATAYSSGTDIRKAQLSLDCDGKMYVRNYRDENKPWYTVLTTNNHSSYSLPLAGGTMNETAQIQRKGGTSSSWYNGRDNALIKYNSYTGYNPLLSMKTTAGSWELGAYSDNKLHLSYITDANYTAKTNAQTRDFVFNVASNTITASIDGNAATATKLQTARTIGVSGVTGAAQSFNGTANIVIPITAVPSTLLTNKSAIKGSEITNDRHWVPSSDASVTNFVSMTAEEYATNASSLATGTIVAITDGVEGYVTTQATSLTCDLPLDL